MKVINLDRAISKFAELGRSHSVTGSVFVDNDRMDGEQYPVYQEYGFVHYATGKMIPAKLYMQGAADRNRYRMSKDIQSYIKSQHSRNGGIDLVPFMENAVKDVYRTAYTLAPELTGKLRRSITTDVKES